ncbi:putative peptidase [Weissella oryzae SG25]|uniref:Putative peptidase n=1 Tax=Weissella oryzae (strain DSM 25784 / JCM 18191 / LMG 30913 / SG25) TaxID=1329250 RepID=A0A069D123_WEIOS|nr:phage tail tip lysozyme [Weissella oryzae]GAK31061.1 putative peptidase [Weissella oryzae SG25]
MAEENNKAKGTGGSNVIGAVKAGKKFKIAISLISTLAPIALGVFFVIVVIVAVTGATPSSCFDTNTASGGGGAAIGGDWKNANSDKHKAMQYAADEFKNKLHMSGTNIAAALAIGLRESNFDPAAVNPAGHVIGLWQWGNGGANGNRYGNTQTTVEGQVALAIKELTSTHVKALSSMKDANLADSLDAWDMYFEGLQKSDPQRKVEKITATAQEVQKVFNLNFDGHIDAGDSQIDNGGNTANSGSNSDMAICDTGVSGTTSGLPVKGKYRITGGYPNYNGETGAAHYGVDFQTIKHTEDGEESDVYSVSDGTVVVKTPSVVGGNYVVIKNTDGTYAYYGHAPSLDSIVVKVGDQVKKGQHISHEGQTGEATGIHVHFGLNIKDQNGWGIASKGLVSPATYLKNFPKQLVPKDGVVNSDMSTVFDASEQKDDK